MKATCLLRMSLLPLLLGGLTVATPARAEVTVINYWRLGESDSGASSGGSSMTTVDLVAGQLLTNAADAGVYPTYTNDVSSDAATATGSQLALAMDGNQSCAGNVIPNLTDNFGIELWVKPAVVAGTRVLAYNGNTSSSGWGIFQTGTTYEALFGGNAIFGSAAASANTWTHLALVRAGGVATLYVNGNPAGTTSIPPNPPSGNFLIGGNNLDAENFWGALDEVRVFTFAPGGFDVTNLLYFQNRATVVTPLSFSVAASAGTNSVSVSVTPSNLPWTASANAPWLHVATSSGAGSGTVTFTYDDNSWVSRSGAITVAGQTITVTQSAPSYSLNGNYDFYWTGDVFEEPWTEGNDSLGITVTPNTGIWSVTSYANWIHPTPNGVGSGTISFSYDENPDPNGGARSGQVWINNGANTFLRFIVFQQARPSGAAQVTYRFTGHLQPYLPQYIPDNASAALKSVQAGDVFYLSMTLVPPAGFISYENWACAVNNITFSVPSRGLHYSKSFADLEVLNDGNNPDTLRWDANGVDSTVNMIFWARDFNESALSSGNVPNPLNLSGFHANGFSQISLYNGVGSNPTLFDGDLVPMPALN
ncbi:MAG TPA: LamG-like jellyroll fold domain-containing protein, partial [Verrucomicrobiae bacterium]|nr:LamG-like jellyroll fold domain-containing protein [Verrucomicrobiae bacterium]